MAETDNDSQQNQPDIDYVNAFLKDRVETYAAEYFKEHLPQQTVQPQQTEEDATRNNLKQILEPFIRPDLDAAKMVAADSRDYVDFYGGKDGKDISDGEKDAVEAMFNNLKEKGRPLPRRDIYDYLQGKLSREKPEEFTRRHTDRQKRQLETANGAVDIGFAAIDRAKNDPVWSNVRSMSLEELGNNLEGVAF
jgi:hypothetical protein